MHPVIFDLGPITINSYGVMLALAFIAGVWYIKCRSLPENIPFESLLNISYILIIAGVIGARTAFVALHWSEFENDLLGAINPFQEGQFGISGLNLYGGVLFGIGGALFYIKRKGIPLLATLDVFAPTLGLGLGIARIGCFLNGCCFGTPTDLPWGISFPGGSIPDFFYGATPIHPTQLYSSAYGIIVFIILHKILKRKQFDGQVLSILFMSESVFRFIIEPLRHYEEAMTFSVLGIEPTYNQLISAGLFIAGVMIYLRSPRLRHRDVLSEVTPA